MLQPLEDPPMSSNKYQTTGGTVTELVFPTRLELSEQKTFATLILPSLGQQVLIFISLCVNLKPSMPYGRLLHDLSQITLHHGSGLNAHYIDPHFLVFTEGFRWRAELNLRPGKSFWSLKSSENVWSLKNKLCVCVSHVLLIVKGV